MDELKPCPFCGAAVKLYERFVDSGEPGKMLFRYWISCKNCNSPRGVEGFRGKDFVWASVDMMSDDRDQLIKAWNRRSGKEE